ncbi:MAG TPA: hypothetical protein PKD90_07610 [Phnomibacter sp.]|nr:hypothetical protein [Phnomibacter sp.]
MVVLKNKSTALGIANAKPQAALHLRILHNDIGGWGLHIRLDKDAGTNNYAALLYDGHLNCGCLRPMPTMYSVIAIALLQLKYSLRVMYGQQAAIFTPVMSALKNLLHHWTTPCLIS